MEEFKKDIHTHKEQTKLKQQQIKRTFGRVIAIDNFSNATKGNFFSRSRFSNIRFTFI